MEKEVNGCVIDVKKKKVAVDSIRISAGVTVNTGDFESARFDCGITLKAVEDNTKIGDMVEAGWDLVKTEIVNQVDILWKAKKARVK